MSLQATLVVIGVLLLAAIYMISKWQERRKLPLADKTPESPQDSAPADSPVLREREEHADEFYVSLRDAAFTDDISQQLADDSRIPILHGEDSTPDEVETPPAFDSGDEDMDDDISRPPAVPGFNALSQIDYWVKLPGERDVSRDSVLAIFHTANISAHRRHGIYGLRLGDEVWCNLEEESEDARFTDLVTTVQLADRRGGAISESELTRFTSLIYKLSESTNRGVTFMAPVEAALEQAGALADFIHRYDLVFIVNIKPVESEYIDGANVERHAAQFGLEAGANRFYTRHKLAEKQSVPLYSLANMSNTGEFDFDNMHGAQLRGVTFFTRPALNRSPGAVFTEMVDAAKAFASRVKGEVVAPGRAQLLQPDIDATRARIEEIAAQMQRLGVPAGGQEAMRLF